MNFITYNVLFWESYREEKEISFNEAYIVYKRKTERAGISPQPEEFHLEEIWVQEGNELIKYVVKIPAPVMMFIK